MKEQWVEDAETMWLTEEPVGKILHVSAQEQMCEADTFKG